MNCSGSFWSFSASAARTSLIIEDLPAPQEPDIPIEVGRPVACVMISATVPATPEKFRKSFSVSLSGHIFHDSQHNHSSSAFSPGGRHPLKGRLDGVRLDHWL